MTPVVELGSRARPVRELRRLVRQAGVRREQRRFVIDGPTLLAVALDAGHPIDQVLVSAEARDHHIDLIERAAAAGASVGVVAGGVLEAVAGTATPNALVASASWCDQPVEQLIDALARDALVVVVDGVADPGNLGTILRSADAAGAAAVFVGGRSAEVFAPKTVRASAGSVFTVPVGVGVDCVELLARLGDVGLRTVATLPSASMAYDELDLTAGTAVVVGNEAHGVSDAVAGAASVAVSIPMAGRAESLNVSMAATVVCFEALRQRRSARSGVVDNRLDAGEDAGHGDIR